MFAECKQFSQTGWRAAVLQEFVLEELGSCGSASDIYTETDRQEGLQLLAEPLRVLQARSTVGSNEVKRFQRFLVQVWWLRLDHFDRHDTQRPDVDLGTILFLLNHFGSHPVWRTDHGSTLRLGFGELSTETEIRYFRLAQVRCKRG